MLVPLHASPLLQCESFPWAAVLQDEPAAMWALHGLQFLQVMSTCSTLAMSRSCRGIPAQAHGAPYFLLLLSSPGSQGCSPHFSQTSPRRRHGGCRAGPCPSVGLLEPAPHRGTPRSPLPAPGHLNPIALQTGISVLLAYKKRGRGKMCHCQYGKVSVFSQTAPVSDVTKQSTSG